MKFTGLLLAAGVVLAVGGVMVYRSTAPNGDVAPSRELLLEEVPDGGTSNSQFLQMKPDLPAPGGDEDSGEEPAASPAGDASVTESPAGEDNGKVTTVSMTDTGFFPEAITITQGDAVKFVNNGQALHWPASDTHPTHELLPDFDAGRGLATGDEYTFTFNEAGIWNFHDHLNAQFKGSVVVEQK